MQRKHVPSMEPRYWAALTVVSVFGANLGDFSSRNLHLGHAWGLLPMAAIVGAVFFLERRDSSWNQAYYWLAIIIIRAAATNFGDLVTHELHLGMAAAIAVLAALLALTLMAANRLSSNSRFETTTVKAPDALPTTDGWYWTAMMIAGTLGTVIGDYSSFGLHLGTANASLVLGGLLAAILLAGNRGLFASVAYYWLTIVAVRSAGTSMGDFFAGKAMGIELPLSTLLTGLFFMATVMLWKDQATRRLRAG
jgi:uncharacterized membrane-anchored protein